MGSLDGEVAVVIGARHGIGAGIADGLAAAGARVAATHHDQAVADGLAAVLGEEHAGFALDVRSTEWAPAGRWATTEDVSRAVVFLCSADAGFVTGQTLTVDGGYTAYGAAHAATRIPGHADA